MGLIHHSDGTTPTASLLVVGDLFNLEAFVGG